MRYFGCSDVAGALLFAGGAGLLGSPASAQAQASKRMTSPVRADAVPLRFREWDEKRKIEKRVHEAVRVATSGETSTDINNARVRAKIDPHQRMPRHLDRCDVRGWLRYGHDFGWLRWAVFGLVAVGGKRGQRLGAPGRWSEVELHRGVSTDVAIDQEERELLSIGRTVGADVEIRDACKCWYDPSGLSRVDRRLNIHGQNLPAGHSGIHLEHVEHDVPPMDLSEEDQRIVHADQGAEAVLVKRQMVCAGELRLPSEDVEQAGLIERTGQRAVPRGALRLLSWPPADRPKGRIQ